MSAIGKINLELEEQAQELGFEGLEEAQEAGCTVEWHKDSAELLEPLEAAHRAFEAEKVVLVKGLDRAMDRMGNGIEPEDLDLIERAKQFIKEAHE